MTFALREWVAESCGDRELTTSKRGPSETREVPCRFRLEGRVCLRICDAFSAEVCSVFFYVFCLLVLCPRSPPGRPLFSRSRWAGKACDSRRCCRSDPAGGQTSSLQEIQASKCIPSRAITFPPRGRPAGKASARARTPRDSRPFARGVRDGPARRKGCVKTGSPGGAALDLPGEWSISRVSAARCLPLRLHVLRRARRC